MNEGTEAQKIAEALETIFNHRESHVVVALTGRTGSGCTSIADILATASFSDLTLPEIENSPWSQEGKKTKIVNKWLREKWTAFLRISVSDIILLIALSDQDNSTRECLKKGVESKKALELDYIFTENFAIASKTINTLSLLRTATDSDKNDTYEFIFKRLPSIANNLR